MSNQSTDLASLFLETDDNNLLDDMDFLTKPFSNASHPSLWNNDSLHDFNLEAPTLQHFDNNPTQDSNKQIAKGPSDFTVSVVSDANLHTSPLTTRISDPKNVPEHLIVSQQDIHNALPHTFNAHPSQKHLVSSRKRSRDSQHEDFSTPSRSLKGRKISSSHSPNHPSTMTQVAVVRDSPISQRRPADENRQRHNKMMRENRSRLNNKFEQLVNLLEALQEPNCEYKPTKNKIQILERAIYQYAQMEFKKTQYVAQNSFSRFNTQEVKKEYVNAFGTIPSLKDACVLALTHLCALNNWKYGEVWLRTTAKDGSSIYQLGDVYISKNNMPDTRNALREFAEKSGQRPMDIFLRKQVQFNHTIWIPNICSSKNQSERAKEAKKTRISTTVVAPISILKGNEADAILVLMHADDELLSYPKQVRPYDPTTITSLLDLATAIMLSRSRLST